jgi:hypothetical protein
MGKPKDKPDIGFQEALRRIAQTPKSAINDDIEASDNKDSKKKTAPVIKTSAAKTKLTK